MKGLNKDWFIEGLVDFEYKKYLLLAYLQQVSTDFAEVKLYPAFSELISHYNNLASFRANREKLLGKYTPPESEILGPDALQEELIHLEAIVEYAIPAIKERLDDGKGIYEFIENQLVIEPIGITPLYKTEGYVLLNTEAGPEIDAYEYKIVFFENVDVNYHGISLNYINSFRRSLSNSFESIKLQLIRTHKKFPNPATYLIYAKHFFPKESALIPVAKRKFLAYMK